MSRTSHKISVEFARQHIADLLNPHQVTPAQVESGMAYWNAASIFDTPVDNTDIGHGKVLAYSAITGNIEYKTVAGTGGTTTGIIHHISTGETITVPSRSQYNIVGELIVDGEIVLEDSSAQINIIAS